MINWGTMKQPVDNWKSWGENPNTLIKSQQNRYVPTIEALSSSWLASSVPEKHTPLNTVVLKWIRLKSKGSTKNAAPGPVSEVSESHSVVFDSFWPHGLEPARPLCPWNSPDQNTAGLGVRVRAVGSRSPLQGIFPIQGLNPRLPHCGWILYHLRILEWVAFLVQEVNRGLLLCRRILYQLSSQGSLGQSSMG